jgi:hypothetical protein
MIGRRRTRSPSAAETRSMSPPPRAVDGAYDAVDDNGSACDGAPSTTGRKAPHTELPIDVALECALLALAAEISECSESSNAVTQFTARFTRPFDDAARALIARCRVAWAVMLQQCRSNGSSDCSEQRLRLIILTLAQVSANVRAGQKTTLRDLYYCLAESAEHRQTATNDAVLRLAQMLERPRHELLVCASTKGLLNGTLRWNGLSPAQTGSLPIPGELACLQDFCRCYLSAGPKERTVWAAAASADLAAASASVDIDGPGVDPVAVVAYADYVHYCRTTAAQQPDAPHSRGFVSLPTQIRLATGTRAVLIVEKEAVFQRLVDSRAWAHAPFVLLTGRGMPDVATRCVVKLLCAALPSAALRRPCRLQPQRRRDPRAVSLRWAARRALRCERCGCCGLRRPLPRGRAAAVAGPSSVPHRTAQDLRHGGICSHPARSASHREPLRTPRQRRRRS